jgi:hypothetical protein
MILLNSGAQNSKKFDHSKVSIKRGRFKSIDLPPGPPGGKKKEGF